MSAIKVHCDECGWEESVATLRHLRAWYLVACPACGQGELIDATERNVVEYLLALAEREIIRVHDGGALRPGELVMHVDTAADPVCNVLQPGGLE